MSVGGPGCVVVAGLGGLDGLVRHHSLCIRDEILIKPVLRGLLTTGIRVHVALISPRSYIANGLGRGGATAPFGYRSGQDRHRGGRGVPLSCLIETLLVSSDLGCVVAAHCVVDLVWTLYLL